MPEEKKKSVKSQSEAEGSSRSGGGHIFALLIGINNYQHINDLGGCIIDLDRIEGFLKQRFGVTLDATPRIVEIDSGGDAPSIVVSQYIIPHIAGTDTPYTSLQICRLEDQQATYDRIINAGFRKFLQGAGVSDKVLFHFSGHGTQAPTAEAFVDMEDGEDQCLICWDCFMNEETGEIFNLLADKELAVLLHEVANGAGGTPHITVTLDCCHSGGATREGRPDEKLPEGAKTRFEDVPGNAQHRPLTSYLGGYYVTEDGKLPQVPASPHVVMTACDRSQLAGERGGGFFTAGLIEALESVDGKISYADLAIRTRAAIRRKSADQTPQFDVLGGTKAYTRFLEGTPEGTPEAYEIKFQHGGWTISCGAIHGLPATATIQKIATAANQPIVVEITSYEQSGLAKVEATATIEEVGPQYSRISNPEVKMGKMDSMKSYIGRLNYLPANPEFVLITGQEEAVKAFVSSWENWQEGDEQYNKLKAKNIHYVTTADPDKAPTLEVVIEDNQYRIKDHETRKFVDMEYRLDLPNEVLFDIIQIVNWRRLRELENPDPNSKLVVKTKQEDGSMLLHNKVQLDIDFTGKNDVDVQPEISDGPLGKVLTIKATTENSLQEENEHERYFHYEPRITIEGKTDHMYVYLLKLWSWYEISADEEKEKNAVLEGETDRLIFQKNRWGLAEGEEKDTVYFKLIATSKELDYHQLLQEGIFDGRGRPRRGRSNEGFGDWTVVTVKVEVVRES